MTLADEVTLWITTRSNAGTALFAWLQLATEVIQLIVVIKGPGIATLLCTLSFIKPAVALLALLNNLVATEGSVVLLEAVVFPLVHHCVQHRADVLDAAGAELVVVVSVPGGGAGEHDVVSIVTARATLGRVVVR